MKGHVYNLNVIVATCNNSNWQLRQITVKNKTDLAGFRNFTFGKIVIMGRKTLKSLPSENPIIFTT